MADLVAADWIRLRRFWLARALLVLLLVIVALQIKGKISRLAELETRLAHYDATAGVAEGLAGYVQEEERREAAPLRGGLRYPAVIGYAADLATHWGGLFLILLTAVMVGEDSSRGTLRIVLSRGVGRGRYLVARCLTLWLAAGLALGAVVLLAAAAGPLVHRQVTDDPLSARGLGLALLVVLRAWLVCLPLIASVLFWAVLARHPGPAMAVGIGLRAMELAFWFTAPVLMILVGRGVHLPWFYRAEIRLYSLSLGYNADLLLAWGSPYGLPAGGGGLLPTDPWRGAAFLVLHAALSLGLALWVLRRRDVTYGP